METPTFNFFPNSLSLFEIVKRFFPDGIEHFKEHLLASSAPGHVISKQLNHTHAAYHGGKDITEETNYEHLRYQGYWAKVNGCDMNEIALCLLYDVYKRNFTTDDKKLIEINIAGQLHRASLGYETEPARSFEEHVERQFFEYLSHGVNAAILEGYLLTLKKRIEANSGIFDTSMLTVDGDKGEKNRAPKSLIQHTTQIKAKEPEKKAGYDDDRASMASVALYYALVHQYGEGIGVTDTNRENLAAEHGFKSKTSGLQLQKKFKEFIGYNQQAFSGNGRADNEKLQSIQAAVKMLSVKPEYPNALLKAKELQAFFEFKLKK